MNYEVEIWGWKCREEIERIQERYLRWVLGVSRRLAGYLEGRGGQLAWRCRMEMRKRIKAGRGLVGWELERENFFKERGWSLLEVERSWEEGCMRGEELVRLEKRRQEKERWDRISEARSNSDYKFIKGSGIPGYLKKGWSEERWIRVARFRLGDTLKGSRYW
ncbi:GSCOCG00010703001-RA-CDS, partial [Cotesia congregata]